MPPAQAADGGQRGVLGGPRCAAGGSLPRASQRRAGESARRRTLRVVLVLDCRRLLMLSNGVLSRSSASRCLLPARDIF